MKFILYFLLIYSSICKILLFVHSQLAAKYFKYRNSVDVSLQCFIHTEFIMLTKQNHFYVLKRKGGKRLHQLPAPPKKRNEGERMEARKILHAITKKYILNHFDQL